MLGLRARHQYIDQSSSQIRAPCAAFAAVGSEGKEDRIVSIKRTAEGRRQTSREITDKKREKYSAKNGFLQNTSTDSNEATLVILKNNASVPTKQERLSSTSKARKGANRHECVEKGGMPDRVENF